MNCLAYPHLLPSLVRPEGLLSQRDSFGAENWFLTTRSAICPPYQGGRGVKHKLYLPPPLPLCGIPPYLHGLLRREKHGGQARSDFRQSIGNQVVGSTPPTSKPARLTADGPPERRPLERRSRASSRAGRTGRGKIMPRPVLFALLFLTPPHGDAVYSTAADFFARLRLNETVRLYLRVERLHTQPQDLCSQFPVPTYRLQDTGDMNSLHLSQ